MRLLAGPRQWNLHLSSLILNGCVCRGGRQLGHASAAFRIPNRAAKMRKGFSPKHRANQWLLQQQLWFPSIKLPQREGVTLPPQGQNSCNTAEITTYDYLFLEDTLKFSCLCNNCNIKCSVFGIAWNSSLV